MNNPETSNILGAERRFRPTLAFYHPNARGTGGALKMELHPAHDEVDGSIMAMFARQLTVGDRSAMPPVFPTFDWDNLICVKLDFNDLTKMLEVFRGVKESLENGKGLYHTSPKGVTKIQLRHMVEPDSGYSFEVYRTPPGASESVNARLVLSSNEAYGLAIAIEDSLGAICFGIPMVIPRDKSAYKKRVREMRDAPAA